MQVRSYVHVRRSDMVIHGVLVDVTHGLAGRPPCRVGKGVKAEKAVAKGGWHLFLSHVREDM